MERDLELTTMVGHQSSLETGKTGAVGGQPSRELDEPAEHRGRQRSPVSLRPERI